MNICWIRRDLRLHDHAALSSALEKGETTLVFVFDPHILDKLKNKEDRRVTFIYQSLREIETEVQKHGSSLIIKYGNPEDVIPSLAQELRADAVYCNRDYEPYAKERDSKVQKKLKSHNIGFEQFKDSVFFEKDEVLTGSGTVYKVFTPYKNKWLEKFHGISDYECDLSKLRKFKNPESILSTDWYKKIGFIETPPILSGGTSEALKRLKNFQEIIDDYKTARDFPAIEGTSLLSVYIRHGNISVRDMLRAGKEIKSEGAKTWISEIIWRDFYQMILDAFPHVEKSPFKPEYAKIQWKGSDEDFKAWCEGRTGFPIVDAAMRCLNATGMMHNRLRMIVASFLCKTLLVDWQKGEKYFAEKLLDYDLAANNGGWQWAASTGCDAQPYFRIFNPHSQTKKFDPKNEFIRAWVPEFGTSDYIEPIVSYETNRRRALMMYSVVKNK